MTRHRLAPLLLVACLTACASNDANGTRGPDVRATLPAAAAFKDALLVAAVKTKLAADDIDSTTRIRVAVHAGAVTLSGRVPTVAAKARAVTVARSIGGVSAVEDRLQVGNAGPSAAQSAGDLALVAAVEAALTAQTGVNVGSVRVRANAGTVTLEGRVDSPAIRDTMVSAARKTPGVRAVVDRLAVR